MNVLSTTAHRFIQHGQRPATDRERSALLDELRSVLSDSVTAWTPPTDPAGIERIQRNAEAQKAQRQKADAELDRQIAAQREKLRKQAAVVAKPIAMTRAEFQKLTAADKSRFSKQGGKLI